MRHAGNLLILSHLEHHRVGRRLSREQITQALKAANPKTITFGNGDGAKVVTGVVADVLIPTTGEVVSLFFTDWHKRYWLEDRVET